MGQNYIISQAKQIKAKKPNRLVDNLRNNHIISMRVRYSFQRLMLGILLDRIYWRKSS
jgi:hypothetical protein